MKTKQIIPLVLLLLGGVWVSWVVGQEVSCTGTTAGTIQVTDADTVSCFEALLKAASDRIALQYADTNRQTFLVAVPAVFVDLFNAAMDRVAIQYADSIPSPSPYLSRRPAQRYHAAANQPDQRQAFFHGHGWIAGAATD